MVVKPKICHEMGRDKTRICHLRSRERETGKDKDWKKRNGNVLTNCIRIEKKDLRDQPQ